MFFQFTSVYAFLLIVAILLLIFKSESSENSYFIARILLFGYSVLTSALLFIPRFIICFYSRCILRINFIDPYICYYTI